MLFVRVASGFHYRTRRGYAAVIRAASSGLSPQVKLSPMEQLALARTHDRTNAINGPKS
jgi:hypothetical protein